MVSLVISLSIVFFDNGMGEWITVIVSLVDYYILFVMILNMLILIKRFKALIDNG